MTGLIIFCAPAIGRMARFRTRLRTMWIQHIADTFGWKGVGDLSEEVLEELRFWRDNLDSYNGQMIRTAAGVTTVDLFGCSDSGGHMLGGTLYIKGKEISKKRFQVNFSEEEKGRSSPYRELRGMEDGLSILGPDLRGKRLQWGCDNWAACRAVELACTKEDCMEIALRIAKVVERFEIDLQVVWKRRNTKEITLCDKLSKDLDIGESRLSMGCFSRLEAKYGPFSVESNTFRGWASFKMRIYSMGR